MLANTLPVGAALGAYGTALLPYIPQLPLEWAGLAAGYAELAAKTSASDQHPRARGWLAIIGGLLLTAAVVETVAVPHR